METWRSDSYMIVDLARYFSVEETCCIEKTRMKPLINSSMLLSSDFSDGNCQRHRRAPIRCQPSRESTLHARTLARGREHLAKPQRTTSCNLNVAW